MYLNSHAFGVSKATWEVLGQTVLWHIAARNGVLGVVFLRERLRPMASRSTGSVEVSVSTIELLFAVVWISVK
jgi:hypothetical protein